MNIIEFKTTNKHNRRKKKSHSKPNPALPTQEEMTVLMAKGGLEMIYLKINVDLLMAEIKNSPVLGVAFTEEMEQEIRSLLLDKFSDGIVNKVFLGECPESLSPVQAIEMRKQMYRNLADKYLPLEEKDGVYLSVDEREEKQQDVAGKVKMFPGKRKK